MTYQVFHNNSWQEFQLDLEHLKAEIPLLSLLVQIYVAHESINYLFKGLKHVPEAGRKMSHEHDYETVIIR